MPSNDCLNYIRIVATSAATRNYLRTHYFSPFIVFPPPPLPEADRNIWIANNYGTHYMTAPDRGPISLIVDPDVAFTATFISVNTPPIEFYRNLVRKFPDILLEFEFLCYGSETCGHGSAGLFGFRSENHKYANLAEFQSIKCARQWILAFQEPDIFTINSDMMIVDS